MHKAFYRPTTRLNVMLEKASTGVPPKKEIDFIDIRRWRDESYAAYRSLGYKNDILKKIVTLPVWEVRDPTAPPNVWFGEATFFDRETPRVIFYSGSLTSRLRPRWILELAGQAGMDHQFAHLYAFYDEQDSYGEEIACRMQRVVAFGRKTFSWYVIGSIIPLIYKFHKDIPFSNYASRN